MVDGIEMSDVAADDAAFLATCTTDALAADTTDVLYAAKASHVLRGQALSFFSQKMQPLRKTRHLGMFVWEESATRICSGLPFGAGYHSYHAIWSRERPNQSQNYIF